MAPETSPCRGFVEREGDEWRQDARRVRWQTATKALFYFGAGEVTNGCRRR